jgi:glucose-1-phosphate adenylyltransferase
MAGRKARTETSGRLLALILAGGEGNRLDVLTEERAKPAMPFGGVYRLIDFPLSNCMHSGISDVWVLQQYEPHTLNDHLSNGRPWDLDRTHGGLRILPPFIGNDEGGWHRGNADAIHRHRSFVEEFEPEVILVLSADHVYRLDYRDVVRLHLDAKADVTMVTKQVPLDQAGRFGTVAVNREGRITDFDYKPETPRFDLVTTEVFVYDPRRLLEALADLAAGSDEGGLEDFGDGLLPRLVQDGRAHEYRMTGYWRDLGTVESYWKAHMDLLADRPELDLDDEAWPILTRDVQRSPALVFPSARIETALISPGGRIRGRVERSVLGPGVVVEEGAVVRDSVVLHDTVVGGDVRVERAVVDTEVRLDEGASVGRAEGELAVVGLRARIPAGRDVPAGARVSPGSSGPANPKG